MSDNIVELVQEAQKRGKFNLADAIKGTAYPEKSVDVYLDAASAQQFAPINEKIKQTDPESPEYAELNEKLEELSEKIKASKLTFHMRGVGQGTVEKATEAADEVYPPADGVEHPLWTKYYVCYLIAQNIVKITDAEGNEDNTKLTVDDVMQIRDAVPIDAWEVSVETMQKLTLASSYFDIVTDAGFLPKS